MSDSVDLKKVLEYLIKNFKHRFHILIFVFLVCISLALISFVITPNTYILKGVMEVKGVNSTLINETLENAFENDKNNFTDVKNITFNSVKENDNLVVIDLELHDLNKKDSVQAIIEKIVTSSSVYNKILDAKKIELDSFSDIVNKTMYRVSAYDSILFNNSLNNDKSILVYDNYAQLQYEMLLHKTKLQLYINDMKQVSFLIGFKDSKIKQNPNIYKHLFLGGGRLFVFNNGLSSCSFKII